MHRMNLIRVLILVIASPAIANPLMFTSTAADEVLVSAGKGPSDDVRNGGFESPNNHQSLYSQWEDESSNPRFESWKNYRFAQQRRGRGTRHSPPEGKYCGIVNSVTSGNGSEPSIDTGYQIQSGDRFTLSFRFAGATGWKKSSGLKIVATLYYDDDGDDQDGRDTVIERVSVEPTANADQQEEYEFSGKLTFRCSKDSVGQVARLRFQTNMDQDMVAVIDDVLLSVSTGKTFKSNPGLTYLAGELPIILSAPHGGRKGVPQVEIRQGKNVAKFNSRSDLNTDRLTERLATDIEKRMGKRPYLIIARFHRRFIDANRPSSLAYESRQAKGTYDAYHQALATARREVTERWGHGLLLDIHGQAARPKAIVRGTQNGKTTKHLIARFGQHAWRGETSLFGRLSQQGFPVIPPVGSTDQEDPKYIGGYIVRTYGSNDGGTLDAIQLELGKDLRSSESLPTTSKRIADAIAVFAEEYLPASRVVETSNGH